MNTPKKNEDSFSDQDKANSTHQDQQEQVQQSNDEKIDQDFPGYPHYPAKEDILNPQNHAERVDANVENLTRDNLRKESSMPNSAAKANPDELEDQEDLGIVPGTEADVTAEDLRNLGPKDRDMDMGEDEEIASDASASAFSATEETEDEEEDLVDKLERTGDDLDIPGEELDDANEDIGEEDEENNYYSLGGDEKDNLEEDPTDQGY